MILADTGPLVALCDGRDRLHAKALAHLSRLARAGLCVCEAVLVESCFHLPGRAQRSRLAAVLQEFSMTSLPTHETSFRQDVFGWLEKYADHEPDWADACIAVLCARYQDLRVWTYDREFRTTWRRPDGGAIRLAVTS
jgi:predicted nucleic acid-binding protein